jgi:hypothetical protein
VGRTTNASSQLTERVGLPTLHAPSAPQPGWSHHTRRSKRSPPVVAAPRASCRLPPPWNASTARLSAAPRLWASSQRGHHHPPGRGDPAQAERRVGCPARPLHDPGPWRPCAMISSLSCPPRPHEQRRPDPPRRSRPWNSYTTSRGTTGPDLNQSGFELDEKGPGAQEAAATAADLHFRCRCE